MRKPYFKVGEEVIRKGENYPQADGEYVITEVISAETFKELHPTINVGNPYYYRLEDFSVEVTDIFGTTGEISYHTGEKNLRKKYPPSSEGFHSLMGKIKDNVLEGVE